MEEHRQAKGDREDRLLRIVLVVVAAVVFLPMLLMALAMPMMGWMWTGGMGMGGGGMSTLWGIGMMLVPLALLLLAGYALYRLATGGDREDPALRELRVAYARGDLSDEEFEQRRRRLEREE